MTLPDLFSHVPGIYYKFMEWRVQINIILDSLAKENDGNDWCRLKWWVWAQEERACYELS